MSDVERTAMLRGAAYMREKIAQSLESNPRKVIYELGDAIRARIKLPTEDQVVEASSWIDKDLEKKDG